MKIFISYGNNNLNLVEYVAKNLLPFGKVHYWNQNKELGQSAWNSIYSWIDNSDLVIAIITGDVVERAMAVGNEIGRAIAKGKTVIPLVTPEVPVSALGCLEGITYERWNLDNPQNTISSLQDVILKKKLEKDQQNNALLALGGIIALLTVFSNE